MKLRLVSSQTSPLRASVHRLRTVRQVWPELSNLENPVSSTVHMTMSRGSYLLAHRLKKPRLASDVRKNWPEFRSASLPSATVTEARCGNELISAVHSAFL
jgi:hypothetical protein